MEDGPGAAEATETPRELEMRAVTDVNRRLEHAAMPGSSALDRVKALYWNHRMWSIFIQDLLTPGNLLPIEVRSSYVSLGLFAQRESAAAMSGTRDISLLIAINRDLLDALNAQGTSSATPS